MKKVRYLASAVGAVPVLGMMMPLPAVAAAQAPKPGTKTVSLRHGLTGQAGRLAVLPDTSCAGHTGVRATRPSISTKFLVHERRGRGRCCVHRYRGGDLV
jgi:hypothetical protein